MVTQMDSFLAGEAAKQRTQPEGEESSESPASAIQLSTLQQKNEELLSQQTVLSKEHSKLESKINKLKGDKKGLKNKIGDPKGELIGLKNAHTLKLAEVSEEFQRSRPQCQVSRRRRVASKIAP